VTLLLLLLLALSALVLVVFLLGFRLGGDHWQAELLRVRLEAARAERQMHDLTRQAFVAMAERATPVRRHYEQPS
jgi:uncharacterized membrane protein YciS (DUF1049 family)